LAEDFSDGGPVCVMLGDNCTDANIKKEVEAFADGGFVFLKRVPDPQRFGVAEFDKDGNVVGIEEKPEKPKSNYAITAPYIYDYSVFEKIKKLKPSGRGELEITDVNNLYLKEGKLKCGKLRGFWRDAGTFRTLFEVNKYWANKAQRT